MSRRDSAADRRAALLIALLITVAACRPEQPWFDDYSDRVAREIVGDPCPFGACVMVEDDDGTSSLGVSDEGHGTSAGYVSVCRLVVRRPPDIAVVGFEAVTMASPGDVTSLDGHLAEVVRCSSHRGHTYAVLLVDPGTYAWATPQPGNVVISFEDDGTTLPDRAYARAAVEGEESGHALAGHLCLDVGANRDRSERVCGMHTGDTFQWGTHEARIVRIVWPEPWVTGWVEVAVR